MGLPPTPEELGLGEEEIDDYIDSLPPWERYGALNKEEPPTPRAGWKTFLLIILLFPSSALALASMPFMVIALVFPPLIPIIWFVGFIPLGFTLSALLNR